MSFMDMETLTLNLERVHQHLLSFLKESVGGAGFDGVVLGLSGGIDSALAAALAVEALGSNHVVGLMMPWKTSSPASLDDAIEVADHLGIKTIERPITPMVESFANAVPEPNPLRLGNIMARVRMICIFDEAARIGYLPLGTSNKSELLLGYGTWYGDLASAINPIGDLYKQQVFALSRFMNLPNSVIEKAPSADLEEGQSDEADIGWSYETIDQILVRAIDLRKSRQSIIDDGLPEDAVHSLLDRVARHHFKRMPPVIAKVSARSIGSDFLYRRDCKL
jgi:NAD+ synthase